MKHCETGCSPICTVCGLHKKPVGRSMAPEQYHNLCTRDCEGYELEPTPCDLWPSEQRDDWGSHETSQ